jgi:hypothetical protein
MKREPKLFSTKEKVKKFPGHKLHHENHRGLWPCCYYVAEKYHTPLSGYKLVGWGSPPYPGSCPHAIVFRKTSAADDHDFFEPGYWWVHGNADEKIWR